MHVERLAKLVASAFELRRVAASRSSAILDQLPRGMRAGDFAWPAARRPDEWKGFRRDPEGTRIVEHVSLGELGNAMVALAVSTGGIQREELLRETLAIFGGRRLTPSIRGRLVEALEGTVSAGDLVAAANGVHRAP